MDAEEKVRALAVAEARLDEALWWEHLVTSENYECPGDCMYCKRIAGHRAALAAAKETG